MEKIMYPIYWTPRCDHWIVSSPWDIWRWSHRDKRALLSTSPGTVLKISLVILIQLLQCPTRLALQSSTQVSLVPPIHAAFPVAPRNRYRVILSCFLKSGQKLLSSWLIEIKRSCKSKRFLYIQRECWQILSLVTETKVEREKTKFCFHTFRYFDFRLLSWKLLIINSFRILLISDSEKKKKFFFQKIRRDRQIGRISRFFSSKTLKSFKKKKLRRLILFCQNLIKILIKSRSRMSMLHEQRKDFYDFNKFSPSTLFSS